MTEFRSRLETLLQADPDVAHVLTTMTSLGLPDWRLVAGAVYQSVWNALTGRPRGYGILDWDIAYCDAADLSREAEDEVIRRVDAAFAGWPGRVEARNQARVHLWYERRFATPYPPLRATAESLGRYPSIVHAIAIASTGRDRLDILAPFGLEDLFALRIRPNRSFPNGPSHDRKAARCKMLWPEVTGEFWDGTPLGEAGPRIPPSNPSVTWT